MSGKRLLDAAALFNASRGVARKHVALRQKDFEVWSTTSTLAKAVKSQTDRVTKTARAASFLAARMNETAPIWTKEASNTGKDEPIPSTGSAEAQEPLSTVKEGIEQDHFYEPSTSNSTSDPVPKEELNIRQEKSERYPFPDGTIPPGDSKLGVPQRDRDSFTKPPPTIPKNPLESRNNDLDVASSGESTIPLPERDVTDEPSEHARTLQRKFERQIPSRVADGEEGHSKDVLAQGHDEDISYSRSEHISPVLSSLPRSKIPKHTQDAQGQDTRLPDEGINAEYYSSTSASQDPAASAAVAPEEDQAAEGINLDVFQSPRVAKILGGKSAANRSTPFVSKSSNMIPPTDPIDVSQSSLDSTQNLERVASRDPNNADGKRLSDIISQTNSAFKMRESKVPSSRFGRLWNYGGIAAGMFGGAVSESLRRATGSGGDGSYMLTAGNMDRLVAGLSKMRGAALKLGQMISFQDSMLPPQLQQVLMRVQDSADYMPASQRDRVLASNLGPEWRDLFSSFEEIPIAAASIGQVHSAVLKSNGQKVAVKIQYPGVANSIDSDLDNLAVLLTASRLLPKGLYLDKTIANARIELGWECDYIREAECGERFQTLLADEKDVFVVPKFYPEASGKQVLTMEYMDGIGVTKVQNFTQEQKDWIGTQILRLCLREITEFRFMQTDPNWTNFLYNAETNKLELLDFGASREYPAEFITRYTRLLLAASRSDDATVRDLSIELGYLTGDESKAMLKAHIASVLTLAEPFLATSPEVYDFRDQTITDRVRELIPVMVRERLAPPPEETYSLHRKLSGAFLLCARLGSRVRCRGLFEDSMVKAGLRL